MEGALNRICALIREGRLLNFLDYQGALIREGRLKVAWRYSNHYGIVINIDYT